MDYLTHLIIEHLKSKNVYHEDTSWIISKSNISGRGLFAVCDIQPGEIIFIDSPLIAGPRTSKLCGTMCVNCYDKENLYSCTKGCGLPVCSDKCENSPIHNSECQIILKWKSGEESHEMQPLLLKCLTPIRSLLLNSNQIELLKELTAHYGPEHGFEVNLLKEKLMLNITDLEEELMRFTCMVLNANSFEVTVGNETDVASLRGLYPLSSLMNHSCIPNSMHVFDIHQNMIVKASVLIPKGQEIFHSYTRTYWGTSLRRPHLMKTKKFYCTCSRCEDPSEFETNLDAINCLNCKGLVLPHFVKGRITWECTSCNEKVSNEKATMIISVLSAGLNTFSSTDFVPEDILRFLDEKLAKHLPLSNQIVVELKYKLVWILGHRQKYLLKGEL